MTQQPPRPQPPSWAPPPSASHGWQPLTGAAPRRRANALGIAALAVAAVLSLSGPAQQLVFTLTVAQDGGASIAAISGAFAVVRVVLSLVTIGLAIAGLVVRDRGRILAAAALGIGASTLIEIGLAGGIGLVSSSL